MFVSLAGTSAALREGGRRGELPSAPDVEIDPLESAPRIFALRVFEAALGRIGVRGRRRMERGPMPGGGGASPPDCMGGGGASPPECIGMGCCARACKAQPMMDPTKKK